jgi:hypothetical protein
LPLQTTAAFALVTADPEAGLEPLWAQLQRHIAGQLHDAVALLLVERSEDSTLPGRVALQLGLPP